MSMDPGLRLELKLAKFRHPNFHQRSLIEDYLDIVNEENDNTNQQSLVI